MMQRQEILNTLTQQLQSLDDSVLLNLLGVVKAIKGSDEIEDEETREILADKDLMEAINKHRDDMKKAKNLDDLRTLGYKTLDEFLTEQGLNV
ncbi:MAG: hypothetical protein R2880_04785 [Deinococcales bacterium]